MHREIQFEQLHRLPLFACVLSLSLFYLSIFVSTLIYVNKHSFILFIVGSVFTFCSYFVMNYYLSRYSSSYQNIPDNKKFYVLSNIIKAGLLLIFSPHSFIMLKVFRDLPTIMIPTKLPYDTIIQSGFSGIFGLMDKDPSIVTTIHNMSAFYAIPDFVSLLLVHNMAWSTRIHHIVVIIVVMINFYHTFDYPSVWIGVVVYGIYSSFSYLVNFLLASRFLPVGPYATKMLRFTSFIIYSICCMFNWSWQLYYSFSLMTYPEYHSQPYWQLQIMIYGILTIAFVYDDILLLKWLKFKSLH